MDYNAEDWRETIDEEIIMKFKISSSLHKYSPFLLRRMAGNEMEIRFEKDANWKMRYCIFYYVTIGKRRNGQLIILVHCPHIFIFFLVFQCYVGIYKKWIINALILTLFINHCINGNLHFYTN